MRACRTGRRARTRQVLRVRRHGGVAVVLAVANHGTAQEVGPLSCAARHTQACCQQHRCCCASPHYLVLSRQACCAKSRVGYSCVTSSARKRVCSEQRIFVTEAAASWCRLLCACFLPPKFVDETDESAHSARGFAASLALFRRQAPTPSPAQADRQGNCNRYRYRHSTGLRAAEASRASIGYLEVGVEGLRRRNSAASILCESNGARYRDRLR
jgi:hypothetical protein